MTEATDNCDTSASTADRLHLRVIQINDVYELDLLPNFATLVQTYSKEPDSTLVILAGDFLGPSLLSSLDKGVGMVDVLQHSGVTHVCFGNHECDVPLMALRKRINESSNHIKNRITWINSNMQELNSILDIDTPPLDIVTVRQENPTNPSSTPSLKVGLLGLLTGDPGLYREGAFGNATITPVLPTTQAILDQYNTNKGDNEHVDLWIPLTHQSMEDDRTFAAYAFQYSGSTDLTKHGYDPLFPVILGGHDHSVFDECVQVGSNPPQRVMDTQDLPAADALTFRRIIKTGMDAQNAGIIDIYWDLDKSRTKVMTPSKPNEIKVKMIPTSSFEKDPSVEQRAQDHWQLLRELERAKLFAIHQWQHPTTITSDTNAQMDADTQESFSTKSNRLGPNLASSTLTSMVKMGMQAEVGLVNAGSIRGNADYDQQEFFTWSDLKAELPFSTPMVAIHIPGKVLQECIAYSRQASKAQPPMAEGSFLHGCLDLHYNHETDTIERIHDVPMEGDRQYLTAIPLQLLQGMDNNEPILHWWKAKHNDNDKAAEAALESLQESSIPIKYVIVEFCCAVLWLQLGSFEEMDINHDGVLTKDEIQKSVAKHFGEDSCVTDLVVDNILSIADSETVNGTVSPFEMMIVQLVATDLVTKHPMDEAFFDKALVETARRVLRKSKTNPNGKDIDESYVQQMCDRIKRTIYVDPKTGTIKKRHDAGATLGQLRRRSLLL